jgi:hypothetical protein
VQKRALGALFLGLALALFATAAAAFAASDGGGGRYVVAACALVIGAWLASLGVSTLRR